MTRIQAINKILFMINESKINSLNEMSDEAQSIDDLLDEVTHEVCVNQDPFNILPITLQPDMNGEIQINDNILSVDVFCGIGEYRVVSNRVYNINEKSFNIGKVLECSCKIDFKFEELDPVIQNYIGKLAAVKKVAVDLGNRDLTTIARAELDDAHATYQQHNFDLVDLNFDNNSFTSLFNRDYAIIY